MALSEKDQIKAAERLMEAERTATPMQQLSTVWPDISIEDAYAIQNRVKAMRIAGGARVIGHKVGLTSKAMQESSKIDEPDFGCLFDDMLLPDGAVIEHARYCVPRVEVELAFRLRDELRGPDVTVMDVLSATEYVVPAIELIDARVQNPRKIFDTVADNGAAAAIALGGRPVRPMDVDLRWVGGAIYRNAQIHETGLACGVLGHPAQGVAWLANKLSTFGEHLSAGHIVLSGSFTRPVWAARGDTMYADFGPLGIVSIAFK